ncbi:hypothetical protein OS493_034398 [Desmophyllum pertusum]|uniref:Uncharacterized protein n=1 Tax=Desmophyllum pertusum TaxID=174260 RepID=A0A9W9ZWZ2_9CNID|nr:hypothetical protein OS493_034398 [Desmophyllum pertusum]
MVALQISLETGARQMWMSVKCCQIHAKMEQLAQTFSVAMLAVVFMVGKDLIVLSTRMTVFLQMETPCV